MEINNQRLRLSGGDGVPHGGVVTHNISGGYQRQLVLGL